ncbi:hypothetical protein ACFL6S_26475 [Candidatus Poribacteria bacterium]
MFSLFGRKKDEENWTEVYRTTDLWEAEVIRAALLNESIRATVKSIKGEEKGTQQNIVSVPAAKVNEAQMVIRRTSIVISKKEEIIAEQAKQEEAASQAVVEDYSQEEEPATVEIELTSEPVIIAEKDDVGIILHYEAEDIYELRLNMEGYKAAHVMSAEEWEDFIDFSAQRQEFFILLKEKYPKLAAYVKENKMRPDFLKLIEYSYGKSQPPKK